MKANGILEDICADLGFGATIRLCAVHGGRSLYVPGVFDAEHPLCLLLGEAPYRVFITEYGPDVIRVPVIEEFDQWRRVRQVSEMLSRTMKVSDIARIMLMTPRQIRNYRAQAEEIGLIPLVLSGVPSLMEQALLPGAGECAAQDETEGASTVKKNRAGEKSARKFSGDGVPM